MKNEVFDTQKSGLYFVQSKIGCDLKLYAFVDTLKQSLNSNHWGIVFQFFPQNFQLIGSLLRIGSFKRIICGVYIFRMRLTYFGQK